MRVLRVLTVAGALVVGSIAAAPLPSMGESQREAARAFEMPFESVEVAGILKDDRLLEIDGVATTKMVLPEVRERMRRGTPGSRVKILVEHHGARRVVEIRLRDMV